jgi:hypothetical protein
MFLHSLGILFRIQFPDGTWLSGVSQVADLILGDDVEDAMTVSQFQYYQIFVKGSQTVPVKVSRSEGCIDSVLGLSFSTRWSEALTDNIHHKLPQRELDDLERKEGISTSFIDRLFHDVSLL